PSGRTTTVCENSGSCQTEICNSSSAPTRYPPGTFGEIATPAVDSALGLVALEPSLEGVVLPPFGLAVVYGSFFSTALSCAVIPAPKAMSGSPIEKTRISANLTCLKTIPPTDRSDFRWSVRCKGWAI